MCHGVPRPQRPRSPTHPGGRAEPAAAAEAGRCGGPSPAAAAPRESAPSAGRRRQETDSLRRRVRGRRGPGPGGNAAGGAGAGPAAGGAACNGGREGRGEVEHPPGMSPDSVSPLRGDGQRLHHLALAPGGSPGTPLPRAGTKERRVGHRGWGGLCPPECAHTHGCSTAWPEQRGGAAPGGAGDRGCPTAAGRKAAPWHLSFQPTLPLASTPAKSPCPRPATAP